MTRKDYVLIAEAIKAATEAMPKDYLQRNGAYLAANEISHRLQQDNPRFERKRFLEACGLDPN